MIKVPRYLLLSVVIVDLLATSGDITMTWTSPVLPKLHSNDSSTNPFDRPITSDQESWIGSLINIGAMVGPFPYGFIAQKFGRKISLLCIAVPHIVSYLTYAFSRSVYLYYFGRILNGVAVGGGYTILPMYLGEISEDSNRGLFSQTLNIFWSFGNLVPYVLGPYLPIMWFNIVLACIPSAFFVLFLVFAPESPYFLAMKDRKVDAEKALMKLRSQNTKLVQNEMAEIQKELDKNSEQVSILDFFKSKVYMKGLAISVILIFLQTLTGISVVLFYTQQIFEDAGVTSLKPEVSALIVGLVTFLSSFFVPLMADRAGRRILLQVSFFSICVAHTVFGIYFYLKTSTSVDVSNIAWLPLVSLVSYILVLNVGVGSLPWTVTSELFPTSVKSHAASIVSCVCWTSGFLLTRFYNDLKGGIGTGQTFWLFAGCSLLGGLFTFFFLPETRGKSFQEIQEILAGAR